MIYLERHEPGENLHRYYAIRIDQDLLGQWLLTRAWGRAGAKSGQSLAASFETEAEAVSAKNLLMKQKQKRGYS